MRKEVQKMWKSERKGEIHHEFSEYFTERDGDRDLAC